MLTSLSHRQEVSCPGFSDNDVSRWFCNLEKRACGVALHGVFLFGMGLAAVPFLLSWFLKEVPLRTTLAPAAELGTEEAPAAGTPDERLIAAAARGRP